MFTPFDSPETTILGGTLVVLGYLLAVHGWTFLVAGYGDDSDIPQDVVADQIGRFALVVGTATIGFGAVTTSNGYGFGWQGIVFGATVLLATVGLTYRLNTYEEPASTTPADPVPERPKPRTPGQATVPSPTASQSMPEHTVELSTSSTSPPAERAAEPAVEDPSRAEKQPVEISN